MPAPSGATALLPRIAGLAALAVFALQPAGSHARPQQGAGLRPAGAVHRLVVDGAIHPASAELILRAIEDAEQAGAEALLLVLDTPGGLLESTRAIVKGMLSAAVPVVVYVAPEGARAGSAGAFLTLAAHVAAMAPGTNIGAAHPVTAGGGDVGRGRGAEEGDEGGGDLEEKVVNDAVAFIRAVAERRGRNADWAERAVRESVSIPAEEAVRERVVDLVAANEADLLRALDERAVTLASGADTLHTAGAAVVEVEKGWRFAVLDTIANPNVAFLLMLLGMYGLFFELANPGAIVPGVVGAIALLLGLFAFQALPVNHVGLLLLLLAVVLFLAEIKVVSHGILAIGGAIAFVLGATMLVDSPEPALRVSWAVILPALLVTVGFFGFALTAALRARRTQPFTGREGIVGRTATVRARLQPERPGAAAFRGKVAIQGELWNAVSDAPAEVGEAVEVLASEGLTLRVRPQGGSGVKAAGEGRA
ncbi:MAG: nodulation protein NfeD [Gemmatimonadota bacterium]